MRKFDKLSPKSQAKVRKVTVALREQALARAKARVADLIFKPPTKFFEPPNKTTQ
jgi:hypothetical protein